jgi:5-methylcytosine-specific restriction enzyme B
VVDEINRANLAKVFGELITLLEADKRDLSVTLPQSQETFSIPPNVYILGTMNTADRSIRLMDAALRRRFAFMEMMPATHLLAGVILGNVALDELLEGLNARIMRREGREKQIGHAFLMDNGGPIRDSETLGRALRQDVIPLLQEYCYDDYGILREYLGDRIVNATQLSLNMDVVDDDDALLEALAAIAMEAPSSVSDA